PHNSSSSSSLIQHSSTTNIYTLSLHDALPILLPLLHVSDLRSDAQHIVYQHKEREVNVLLHIHQLSRVHRYLVRPYPQDRHVPGDRKSTRLNSSSPYDLVCRLLLEKKKIKPKI